MKTFRLAKMSTELLVLTIALFGLPVVFCAGAFAGNRALQIPAFLMVILYAWVWLRFRPTRFVLHPDVLEVVWPLKRRTLSRGDMSDVRLMDGKQLRAEIGGGMRVGAGGLWGAFGWLWTRRRGIVQMYVSRTDRFVWIERTGERPWLITPEAFLSDLLH